MAMARKRLSRIAIKVAPNGECTRRRAKAKNTKAVTNEYQAATLPSRSNSKRPSTGPIRTPCRPSAPPVRSSSLLANSSKIRAAPRVTIRRVRSLPRKMVTLHNKPSAAVSTAATHNPNKGSGTRCLANKAAE